MESIDDQQQLRRSCFRVLSQSQTEHSWNEERCWFAPLHLEKLSEISVGKQPPLLRSSCVYRSRSSDLGSRRLLVSRVGRAFKVRSFQRFCFAGVSWSCHPWLALDRYVSDHICTFSGYFDRTSSQRARWIQIQNEGTSAASEQPACCLLLAAKHSLSVTVVGPQFSNLDDTAILARSQPTTRISRSDVVVPAHPPSPGHQCEMETVTPQISKKESRTSDMAQGFQNVHQVSSIHWIL